MVGPRGNAPAVALDALAAWVEGHRDRPVLLRAVPRSVRVEEAPSLGLALREHAPGHPAAEAYADAARAVADAARIKSAP